MCEKTCEKCIHSFKYYEQLSCGQKGEIIEDPNKVCLKYEEDKNV